MQYCDKGNLSRYIKRTKNKCLDEDQTLKILAYILEGIKAMHQNNVIHRDLKPENILLHEVESDILALIGDFGFCRTLGMD